MGNSYKDIERAEVLVKAIMSESTDVDSWDAHALMIHVRVRSKSTQHRLKIGEGVIKDILEELEVEGLVKRDGNSFSWVRRSNSSASSSFDRELSNLGVPQ